MSDNESPRVTPSNPGTDASGSCTPTQESMNAEWKRQGKKPQLTTGSDLAPDDSDTTGFSRLHSVLGEVKRLTQSTLCKNWYDIYGSLTNPPDTNEESLLRSLEQLMGRVETGSASEEEEVLYNLCSTITAQAVEMDDRFSAREHELLEAYADWRPDIDLPPFTTEMQPLLYAFHPAQPPSRLTFDQLDSSLEELNSHISAAARVRDDKQMLLATELSRDKSDDPAQAVAQAVLDKQTKHLEDLQESKKTVELQMAFREYVRAHGAAYDVSDASAAADHNMDKGKGKGKERAV